MIRARSADGKIHQFPDGTSQAVVDRTMREYAQSATKPSMAKDFVRPIKGAWDKLQSEAREDFGRNERILRGDEQPSATFAGPGSRMIGNIFSLAMSPVQGAVEATATRPAARAIISTGVPVYEHRNPFALHKELPRRIGGQEAEDAVAGDLNLALSAARAGPRPVPRAPPPKPAPGMKPADLGPAKTRAYQAVENAGVAYNRQAVDDLVRGMTDEMTAANISATRHPKASSMLEEIGRLRGREPTLTELDQLRQVIRRDVASSPDASEAFFGRKMIKNLDEFINAAGAGQVRAGDPARGAAVIREARDLNTRLRKVENVQEAVESARLRAGSTGSGGNVDNAMRQNLRRALEDGTWTPDEAKALEEIVVGGQGQNFLRLVGKLSPSGNGLMTALNIGGAAANPLLAIPGLAGIAAKMKADAMTAKKVQQLIEMIAAGGTAATKTPRPPPKVPNLQPLGAGGTAANLFAPRERQTAAQGAR